MNSFTPNALPYFIAEIGFNHEGDISKASEMINAAAESGANAVKFQSYDASDIALPNSEHFDAIKAGELTAEDHCLLAECAKNIGVDFLSTPFSPSAVDLLQGFEVGAFKVASMDCCNYELLEKIASTGKPIFLSTGMATLEEIGKSVDFLEKLGCAEITLMHCISLYPAPPDQSNIGYIQILREKFGIRVGYSDHMIGSEGCMAAFFAGAEIIETHFTLDRARDGADHYHSLDPHQLKQLIDDCSRFLQIFGSRDFSVRPDRGFREIFRRGFYYKSDFSKGHKISRKDIYFCRPQSRSINFEQTDFIGKTLIEDVSRMNPVSLDNFDS